MVQQLTDDQAKFFQIFHGYAAGKMNAMELAGGRFVHYTSAEAAAKMFAVPKLWLRNSQTMNDFSEIHHGKSVLFETYRGAVGQRFQAAINGIFPEITNVLEERFNQSLFEFEHDTYLASLSEHDDSEDNYGRLSMWRAYGNVAIVLNRHVFLTPSDAIRACTSPVAYMDQPEFEQEFLAMTEKVERELAFLAGFDREIIIGVIFQMFRYAVLCTKHPAFKEEKEWRIIYSPSYVSPLIEKTVEIIRGVPQLVYKIPLIDVPGQLEGAAPAGLVNRVIIGPTQFGSTMFDGLLQGMIGAGIPDAADKLWLSGVPLRL